MFEETKKDQECVQADYSLQIAPSKSLLCPEYIKEMPKLTNQQIKKAIESLHDDGFQQIDFEPFKTVIKKVGNQSILYEVSYGFYKTDIAVYVSAMKPVKFIDRDLIGQGKMGKVVKFNLNKTKIAAKISEFVSSNLFIDESVLKQVFINKFASALKAGPKFVKGYQYDIIVLDNNCEFLMELCEKSDTEDTSTFLPNMFQNLALFHHFHLVHRDIKPQNIGWSKSMKKYVFLDFGLSKFIKENLGEMTFSPFVGSFFYASKQMKNAYYLDFAKVDLYYNDLHGTKVAFQDIIKNSEKKVQEKFYLIEYIQSDNQFAIMNKPLQLKYQWSQLIPYFNLKYSLFFQKTEEIYKFLEEGQKLINSFIQIIKQEAKQPTKTKFLAILNEKSQHTVIDQFLKEESIDSELFSMLKMKNNSQIAFLNINSQNLHIIVKRNQLSQIWKQPHWMQAIFTYLFIEKIQNCKITEKKNQLVDKICSLESYQNQASFVKLVFVIKIFEGYFKGMKNIEMLYYIALMYRLMFYIEDELFLQDDISQILADQNNALQYFEYTSKQLISRIVNQNYDLQIMPGKVFPEKTNPNIYLIGQFLLQINQIENCKGNLEVCTLENFWKKFNEMKICNSNEETALSLERLQAILKVYIRTLIELYEVDSSILILETQLTISQTNLWKFCLTLPSTDLSRHLQFLQSSYIEQKQTFISLGQFINNHYILSQSNSIWSLAYLQQKQKNQESIQILKTIFSAQYKSLVGFKLFLVRSKYFSFQIMNMFRLSDEAFDQYKKFFAKIPEKMFIQQNSEICFLIYLLQRLTDDWNYYMNFTKPFVPFIELIKAHQPIISMISQQLKNRLEHEKVLLLLLSNFTDLILNLVQNGQSEILNEEKVIETVSQIIDYSSENQNKQTVFIYNFLQIIEPQLTDPTKEIIKDVLFKKFSKKITLEIVYILNQSRLANKWLVQGFYKNGLRQEMQLYFYNFYKYFSFSPFKKLPINTGDILHTWLPLRLCNVHNFTLSYIIEEKLEAFSNYKLIFLLSLILNIDLENLNFQVQRRMTVLICHNLKYSFISSQLKNSIEVTVLKWHRKAMKLRGRKGRINFKREMCILGKESWMLRYVQQQQSKYRIRFKKNKQKIMNVYAKKIKNLKKCCRKSVAISS